eukprot:TRINITY_DN0_c3137_g1_i1.p1 TRINITY_DN0_c3137_g1~~TRINITY_DN0_c3137_g1_i1.p1  ORF type:complete len:101 (+),score=21.81 TRINITY_DN0_c3137_g1_i1:92-394(+)
MAYNGFTSHGGVSACYPFYERFITCARDEPLPVKMCSLQAEDFIECLGRKKEYALNYKVQRELHKFKILSLPRYNVENDTFYSANNIPNAEEVAKRLTNK